jgi:membrane protein implicated in regulation of membrane protease activity
MDWWIWFILAFVLFGLEMFLPLAFFFFFVALAFILTGLLALTGILLGAPGQLTFAAILSVVFLLVLRPYLKGKSKQALKNPSADIIGEWFHVENEIPGESFGKGVFRGSSWQVHNQSSEPLLANSRHKIKSVDGLTLIVK